MQFLCSIWCPLTTLPVTGALTDRVTALGFVCERMTKRVMLSPQEDEDRRGSQETDNLCILVESDDGEEKDKEDAQDTGDYLGGRPRDRGRLQNH